jgi:hypothetical protein
MPSPLEEQISLLLAFGRKAFFIIWVCLAFAGLAVVFYWPILSLLIRIRAHYAPKRISLPGDGENEVMVPRTETDADSEVKGIWSFYYRTKRIEVCFPLHTVDIVDLSLIFLKGFSAGREGSSSVSNF